MYLATNFANICCIGRGGVFDLNQQISGFFRGANVWESTLDNKDLLIVLVVVIFMAITGLYFAQQYLH